MKFAKRFTVVSLILAVLCLFTFAGFAVAEDQIMNKKIDNVKFKKDKNGNPYAMFIVPVQKELNGISYSTGAAVMAFSDVYAKAKTLKKGDTLHAVVAKGEYKGRTSYTVLKFIDK